MAESDTQELYSCDGCSDQIPNHRARVSCHSCPNYNLCANCFVIKQFSSTRHNASHSTMVFKLSGFVVPTPPGFAPRPPPALPPRTNSVVLNEVAPPKVNRLSEIPTANWGALWNVIKAPLEKRRRKEEKDSTFGKDDGAASSSLIKIPEHGDDTSPLYPMPSRWEPFFKEDATPNPIFIALMSTIFSHLDPRHTGYLSPEVYSGFLEAQGYPLNENTWQNALDNQYGDRSLDVADLQLGLHYADLDVTHILTTRPKADEPADGLSAAVNRIRGSISSNANTPMLSRQGFIDLASREYFGEPTLGFVYLGNVIAKYGIWRELGPITRSVLPTGASEEPMEAGDIDQPLQFEGNFLGEAACSGALNEEHEGGLPELEKPAHVQSRGENEKAAVSEDEQKNDAVPTSPDFSQVTLNGGEKKIAALLNGDEWDEWDEPSHSSDEAKLPSISKSVEVAEGVEKPKLAFAEGYTSTELPMETSATKIHQPAAEESICSNEHEVEKTVLNLRSNEESRAEEAKVPEKNKDRKSAKKEAKKLIEKLETAKTPKQDLYSAN